MISKCLFFLIVFLSFHLRAEGFKPKRLYVNAQAGKGWNVGSNGSLEGKVEQYSTPLILPNYIDLSEAFQTNYLIAKSIENITNLSNNSFGFGFEYGLWNYLGFGLSYEKLMVRTSNIFIEFR